MRLGHRERGSDSVLIAKIEQHRFRDHSRHFSRWEIHNKESLLAFNLARIRTFPFHSSENGALVVTEIDFERN
jgi:hypothetical protein